MLKFFKKHLLISENDISDNNGLIYNIKKFTFSIRTFSRFQKDLNLSK